MSEEVAVTAAPNAPQKIRQIQVHLNRFGTFERFNQRFAFNAEINTTLEEVLEPGVWASVAKLLNPFDRIEVRSEDCTWLAELLVLEVGKQYARVKVLHYHRLDSESMPARPLPQDALEVAWKGPQNKWSVIRKADGVYLSKENATREAAEVAKRNYEQTILR